MIIETKREDNTLYITLEGELNTASAPDLEAALVEEVKDDDTVIFDMTELSYITSAGLRIIVSCYKQTVDNGALILRDVNEDVREIFEVTGLDSFLTFE